MRIMLLEACDIWGPAGHVGILPTFSIIDTVHEDDDETSTYLRFEDDLSMVVEVPLEGYVRLHLESESCVSGPGQRSSSVVPVDILSVRRGY